MNISSRQHLTPRDVKSAVETAGRGMDVLREVADLPVEVLDKKHHPCPNCGGRDRFRVVNVRTGDIFCNHGCFGGRKRADVLTVVQTMQKVTFSEAVRMVAEYVGAETALQNSHFSFSKKHYAKNENENEKNVKKPVRVTHYDYDDGMGMPHLRVTRWDFTDGTKTFRQFHWDARRRQYASGVPNDWPPVPFNAVEVKEASVVYFVEGEKCAVALTEYFAKNPPALPGEWAVTCIPGGVNGWKQGLGVWFLGKKVIILPDNDVPGYCFAWEVKREIEQAAAEHGRFSHVTVFHWPSGTPEKYDIADVLAKNSPEYVAQVKTQVKGATHEYA